MKKAESMNIEPYNLILLTKLPPPAAFRFMWEWQSAHLMILRFDDLTILQLDRSASALQWRLRRETEQEFHDCLFAE